MIARLYKLHTHNHTITQSSTMSKITAVLVDDMPIALDLLSNSIQQGHKEIDIIGTAKSVVEAAKLLRKVSPDILFLDIMLGDGTGFDLSLIHI